MMFNFVWGLFALDYRQDDIVELEFELSPGVGGNVGWVWAIVKKDYMETERKSKWELVGGRCR